MTFEDIILYVIQKNSGGVEKLGLISEIVATSVGLSKEGKPVEEFEGLLIIAKDHTSPFLDALDRKLEEMEEAGKIGMLHYGWDMGGEVRAKTFIYSPIRTG